MNQNFELSSILLKTICPNNEFVEDKFGKPSVMVYIPKFKMNQVIGAGSDKVHPAFIVGGAEKDGFYVSKYQNTDASGVAYSLPAAVPCNDVGIVDALEKSESKGQGWHLTTVQEWGAIALWCKKNSHLPYGNNDNGKDRREDMFKAIPAGNAISGAGPVLTGTGPLSWSHDGTSAGIWDLNGNLSEWVGGIRMVFGEIQVIPDNDAALDDISHDADSTAWRAICSETGRYIVPDGDGNTKGSVKLDFIDEPFFGWSSKWVVSSNVKNRANTLRRCDFSFIACDESIGTEAKELLIALGLIADDPLYDYKEQYVYYNNGAAEVFMYRGGFWGSGAFAGVFCWTGKCRY